MANFNGFFGGYNNPYASFNELNSFANDLNNFSMYMQQQRASNPSSSRGTSSTGATSKRPWMSRQDVLDETIIEHYSKNVIGGFLNLDESGGWPAEGHVTRVGAAFTRFLLRKYFHEGQQYLGTNKPIFEKAVNAFRNTGDCYEESPGAPSQPKDGHRPTASRCCYDSGVTGWQKHAVVRVVGNIATDYSPQKPCFEILINSARYRADSTSCNPFFVTIHHNEKKLDERRTKLASMNMTPVNIAHSSFYDPALSHPRSFYEKHQSQIGPNSKRILEALAYLEKVKIAAQKVGNCWMKQPLRALLVTLYMEILSNNKDISIQEAWTEAKELYKRVQLFGFDYIEQELMPKATITAQMRASASEAIRQRKLL